MTCLDCLYDGDRTELAPRIEGYQILDELGRGGMGIVYRARQLGLDRIVAVKVMSSELAGNRGFRGRFAREARLLARLSHPGIIAVHDWGETDETCYLVMELVDGAPVRPCGSGEAIRIARLLCDALAAAHQQGIVHRDIKASNVLAAADGQIKLVDFGIAALVDATSQLTAAGEQVGTPGCMSPEAKCGARPDFAMDVYGVAKLIRELAGAHALPGHLERVIDQALATDPGARPTLAELRAALAERELSGWRAAGLGVIAAAAAALAVVAQQAAPRAEAPAIGEAIHEQPSVSHRFGAAERIAAVHQPTVADHTARAERRTRQRRSVIAVAESSAVAEPGTLVLRVAPWALVAIDGGPARTVEPPGDLLSLPAGEHELWFSNPASGIEERRRVAIESAQTTTVAVNLARRP